MLIYLFHKSQLADGYALSTRLSVSERILTTSNNAAYSFLDEHTPIGKSSPQDVDPLTTETSPRHSLCFRTADSCALSFLHTAITLADVIIMFAVRFPYTMDTYNNPQNLWKFAYVCISHIVL